MDETLVSMQVSETFREYVRQCLSELEALEIRAITDTLLRWVKVHPQLMLSDPVIEQFREDCNLAGIARFCSRVCMLTEVHLSKDVYSQHIADIIRALNCYDSRYTLPIADEPILGLRAMVDRVLDEKSLFKVSEKMDDSQVTNTLITIVLANRFLQFALLLAFSSVVIDLKEIKAQMQASPA